MKPKYSEWSKTDSIDYKPEKHKEVDVAKKEPKPKKERKTSTTFKHFLDLLYNNSFDEFTAIDWRFYFKYKAKEHGINLVNWSVNKEASIIKSLMGNYTANTIKNLIDFLWDADHDIIDKRTMHIWILSKGWMQSVYPKMQDWLDGKLNKHEKHNKKEWKGTSSEDSEEIMI